MKHTLRTAALAAILILTLSACKKAPESVAEASVMPEATEPSATNTQAPILTQEATTEEVAAATQAPTPTPSYTQVPNCTFGAEFVQDVNYPDGARVKP